MSATQQSKDPVLVVLQLTGGNDYLNTVFPYNNGLYKDNRKAVGIADSDMIQLDQAHAIPKYMAPLKKFWDDDKLAIMHGVGYLDSPRSHFRSMDIWHTCEAEKVGTEGWLGRVVREFDPKKENVVTAVSFGPCCAHAVPLRAKTHAAPILWNKSCASSSPTGRCLLLWRRICSRLTAFL